MSKKATFAGNYFINTGIMVSGGMKKEIEVFATSFVNLWKPQSPIPSMRSIHDCKTLDKLNINTSISTPRMFNTCLKDAGIKR